jgi:GTP-binding protein
VDLPGYGYARGGEESVQELKLVVDAYFAAALGTADARTTAARRGAIFLLIDSRHPALPADIQAHHWIGESAVPPLVIATKVDKLSRAERAKHLRELERIYHRPALPVSTISGEGIDALWKTIATTARTDA